MIGTPRSNVSRVGIPFLAWIEIQEPRRLWASEKHSSRVGFKLGNCEWTAASLTRVAPPREVVRVISGSSRLRIEFVKACHPLFLTFENVKKWKTSSKLIICFYDKKKKQSTDVNKEPWKNGKILEYCIVNSELLTRNVFKNITKIYFWSSNT